MTHYSGSLATPSRCVRATPSPFMGRFICGFQVIMINLFNTKFVMRYAI